MCLSKLSDNPTEFNWQTKVINIIPEFHARLGLPVATAVLFHHQISDTQKDLCWAPLPPSPASFYTPFVSPSHSLFLQGTEDKTHGGGWRKRRGYEETDDSRKERMSGGMNWWMRRQDGLSRHVAVQWSCSISASLLLIFCFRQRKKRKCDRVLRLTRTISRVSPTLTRQKSLHSVCLFFSNVIITCKWALLKLITF